MGKRSRITKAKKYAGKGRRIFCVLGVLLAVCLAGADLLAADGITAMAAKKDEGEFGLAETSISLYVGNTYQLETVNADPVEDEFGWSYSVGFSSSDQNIVRVDAWSGLVRAVGAGEADISAYYMGKTVICHVKVKATHCELSTEKLVLYQGQEAEIILTNSKQKGVSYEHFVYNKEDNYESGWALDVEEAGKGVFVVRGSAAGEYYLDLSLTNRKGESYSARCEVEVLECGFPSGSISVAEGATIPLEIVNGEFLSGLVLGDDSGYFWDNGDDAEDDDWDTPETGSEEDSDEWDSWGTETTGDGNDSWGTKEGEDPLLKSMPENRPETENVGWAEIARNSGDSSAVSESKITMDDQGNLTGVLAGDAKIRVTWRTAYGEEREDTITVYVTNPEYVPFENKLFAGDWYYPSFQGTNYYSRVTAVSSNDEIVEVQTDYWGSVTIMPKKAGKATLEYVADGRKFSQKVQVINPKWGQDCAVVKKGKAKVLPFTDLPKGSEVVWKTSNKKIATVSPDGKVTGKKLGSAVITATLEGKTFSCTVTVGSGKGVDAAQKGEAVLGSVYSQEKRMQKGYYDCSSFVWRSYSAAGLDLGGVSYAPTAAELARKLEADGKAIAYEYVEADELKPGDLIFYAGSGNGRYKNIDHVSMYYGTYYSWGDVNSGMIIHAAGGGVQFESYSWYCAGSIVMIARPVK